MPLFDANIHQAAQADIRAALSAQLGDSTTLTALAENFEAVMTEYNVPLREVLTWIWIDVPGKHWTTAEFKRWCEWRRQELKQENQAAEARLPEGWPE